MPLRLAGLAAPALTCAVLAVKAPSRLGLEVYRCAFVARVVVLMLAEQLGVGLL